jgi:hypothetical protein
MFPLGRDKTRNAKGRDFETLVRLSGGGICLRLQMRILEDDAS